MDVWRLRFFVSSLGLIVITSSLLSACSLAKPPFEPQTLRINLGAEPPSLDWALATDSASFDVISNIMVGLTQYRNDLTCAPACARSWEVSDGGKRYLFHLRQDVYWSDGKPLVASDFEYAWKRLLDPKTGAQYAYFLYDIENAFEFNTGALKDKALVGVCALDNATLVVRLKKPAQYFIYLTAFCPTYPQRQDVIERFASRWTEPEHIVTNGPFLLKRWEHEYKIELSANTLYFEGSPHLEKIKMFMVPEQATAFALYENDELDYVDNRSFSTADVERYKRSNQYRSISLLRNTYIGFNVRKKPFTDLRVRRALSMAVDRSVFPRILRRNERPAWSWLPPQLAHYTPTSGIQFKPHLSRQLLSEAGFPGGRGFPQIKLLYPSRGDAKLVVEAVQDELKRNLNVHVDLVNEEWKVYLAELHSDPPHMFSGSWGADYPDPETFMNLFMSHNGNNNTRWANKKYDALIERAAAEQNALRRQSLYAQADAMLCQEEAPIAPIFLSTQNIMVKPWVKGIELNALDMQFFKNVSIADKRREKSLENALPRLPT